MKHLTLDILKNLIKEEVSELVLEDTTQELEDNAVDTISGILIRLDAEGIGTEEIITKAKQEFERNKATTTTENVSYENLRKKITEMCGDMQSIDMEVEPTHHEEDHEGSMAKRQMYKTAQYAAEIFDNIQDGEEFPAWIQSKMTKIADYIGVVKHYLEYDHVMGEKLDKDADAGDYVKDFRKSKAPQFKGKSKKKKQEMAVAAYLDAQENK